MLKISEAVFKSNSISARLWRQGWLGQCPRVHAMENKSVAFFVDVRTVRSTAFVWSWSLFSNKRRGGCISTWHIVYRQGGHIDAESLCRKYFSVLEFVRLRCQERKAVA